MNSTIMDDLARQGINVNIKAVGIVTEVLVLLLFVWGMARALYQWLSPKFGAVSWLGRLLRVEAQPSFGTVGQQESPWRTLLLVSVLTLASRFLIYGFGYLVCVNRAVSQGYPSYGFFESFMNIWNRWDSPHYIDIARDWYLTEAQVTQGDSYLFIVFFPLLPLLMRISGLLVSNPTNAFYFFSGCVISNIAMCLGCFYIFRLTQAEYGRRAALWTLLLVLFTPASLFFGICYTEALFLCLCAAFFWYLRRGRYVAAGLLGALAAFTRSLGVLLVVPFFVEWMDTVVFAGGKKPERGSFPGCLKKLLGIFIIPTGTLAYLAINLIIYGDCLKFMEYQQHWSQSFSFFASNIAGIAQRVFNYNKAISLSTWLPELIVIMGTLVLFVLAGGKKMRPSYLAYIAVYIVVAAAPSWLLSGVRYFAALIPVHMLLGRFADKKPALGALLTALSAAVMFAYTAGFVCGAHIM